MALSLADAGILFDPSLRSRVFMAGAFWASLLHGDTPLYAAQPVTMFLSHAFLHGSLLHMVMNMTILLALGRFTADHYGARAVLPVFCPRRDRRRRGLRPPRRRGLSDGGRLGGGLRLPRALDRLGLAAAPRERGLHRPGAGAGWACWC